MNAPTWADREHEHITSCQLCTAAITGQMRTRPPGSCRTAIAGNTPCPHPASTAPEARGQVCDWHQAAILAAIIAHTAASN